MWFGVVWSAGATRWDFEYFEVFADNSALWTTILCGQTCPLGTLRTLRTLTGMRCAVVSRTSGIIVFIGCCFFGY